MMLFRKVPAAAQARPLHAMTSPRRPPLPLPPRYSSVLLCSNGPPAFAPLSKRASSTGRLQNESWITLLVNEEDEPDQCTPLSCGVPLAPWQRAVTISLALKGGDELAMSTATPVRGV